MRKTALAVTAILLLLTALAGWTALAEQAEEAEPAETGLEQFIVRHGNPASNKIAITMDDCNTLEIVWNTVELCRQY